jgi:membrane protease YdiL (CAAX protease family)
MVATSSLRLSTRRRTRAYPPEKIVVLGYLVAIAAAEAYLSLIDIVVGTTGYAILLVVMLNHYALRRSCKATARNDRGTRSDSANAVLAIAFVPIMRLVSLAAPIDGVSDGHQLGLIAAPLLAGIAWAAWIVRLPGLRLRFRSVSRLEVGVAAAGVPIGFDAYLLIQPQPLVERDGASAMVTVGVAVSLLAIVEELIFRGFIQDACAALYGSFQAPLWSTAVYAIAYVGVRPLELAALAVCLGIVFAWTVARTQSLVGVTISHCFVNVGLFVVWPAVGG